MTPHFVITQQNSKYQVCISIYSSFPQLQSPKTVSDQESISWLNKASSLKTKPA